METIHKKDGRLHIYVRQDKYKGELKSHNWVGRTYLNGKQKVISSGTTNLDEAVIILEKWFDELQLEKPEPVPTNTENTNQNDQKIEAPKVGSEKKVEVETQTAQITNEDSKPQVKSSILDKLKSFKFSKSNKIDDQNSGSEKSKDNKIKTIFQNFFQSKVSKMSVAGEEIAGLDITKEAIRVAQVSQDKDEKWILDKFSYRLLDQEKIGESLIEQKDYVAEEIELAMANAKITSKNVALSIPVTSAIIRVVTSPLMTDD